MASFLLNLGINLTDFAIDLGKRASKHVKKNNDTDSHKLVHVAGNYEGKTIFMSLPYPTNSLDKNGF